MPREARPYVAAGKLPSELEQPHDWRTRPDPFEEHWPEIEARLQATLDLEAKTLFELLQQQYPGRYEDGQLRTLHRHVKRWRAAHGPDCEVVLAQQHRPGEAAQTDFTHATARERRPGREPEPMSIAACDGEGARCTLHILTPLHYPRYGVIE